MANRKKHPAQKTMKQEYRELLAYFRQLKDNNTLLLDVTDWLSFLKKVTELWDNLEPCPFCGNPYPEIVRNIRHSKGSDCHSIHCECGVVMGPMECSIEEIVQRWNTRGQIQEIRGYEEDMPF